jgi:hypothetical protein
MTLSSRKNTPYYDTPTKKAASSLRPLLVKKKPQAVESAHGLDSIG